MKNNDLASSEQAPAPRTKFTNEFKRTAVARLRESGTNATLLALQGHRVSAAIRTHEEGTGYLSAAIRTQAGSGHRVSAAIRTHEEGTGYLRGTGYLSAAIRTQAGR